MLLESSDRSKLFYIILLSFGGSLLLGLIAFIPELFAPGISGDLNYLRTSILLQDVLVLILPAMMVFKWSFADPARQIGFVRNEKLPNLLFLTFAIFILSSPAISVLAQWNEQISFPDSLGKLEAMFRQMEDAALGVTDRFLNSKSYTDLFLNLFIIAAMAALAEEIFFRGAIQQLLERWFKNGHAAVWVAAFIFSAIHMQFYGFIPRLLMGAVLGYLFLYTKNLWVPIFYHFINNASVVLVKFSIGETSFYDKMENLELNWTSWSAMFISLLLTIYLLGKLRISALRSKRMNEVETWEENELQKN